MQIFQFSKTSSFFIFKNNQIDKEKPNVLTKSDFVKFLSTHLNKGTDEEVNQLLYILLDFRLLLSRPILKLNIQ